MEAVPTELMMEVQHLRLGMYVFLNLGWMDHPFPLNRFKITTEQQIEQIRGLGLKTVKVLTDKSDPKAFEPSAAAQPGAAQAGGGAGGGAAGSGQAGSADEAQRKAAKRQLLEAQTASLARCENLFSEAAASWKQISAISHSEPEAAMVQSAAMVDGFMREIAGAHETSIRLLSEISGDGGALHALNVTVVSLLLGRAMKLDETAINDIGLGALLHDIGKQALPDRLRWRDHLSPAEELAVREHVGLGLQIATRMGLSSGAQQVIFQHHETADGKGYPKGAANPPMSEAAKVVSLVNAYDNLCNPSNPSMAVTPHEALSLMFARLKPRFDPDCLTAFIRLMGVYPPGSLVQLSDERYAMVVSVNAARPLKPAVIVFDTKVPRNEALMVDLQADATLGIRRSLQPRHLSTAALEYLSPRKRMTYFFERAINASQEATGAALIMEGGAAAGPSKVGA